MNALKTVFLLICFVGANLLVLGQPIYGHNSNPLPGPDGSILFQYQESASAGANLFMVRHWMLREGATNDWYSAKHVDGISIDASFTTPQTARTWWKRDPVNGNHYWGDQSNVRLALAFGRLGVGVAQPAATVHLESSGVYWGAYNYGAGLIVGGTAHHNAIGLIDQTNGNLAIANVDGGLSIAKMPALGNTTTAPVNLLNILSNGNVGIGTTLTNGYKLAVSGTIGAREINVNTSTWSDYVFAPEYKLPSLETVERYIKENQHLPEVPSAKEVEENGVNVGEMNALLLKKIEELTLYVIDLKKENQKMQSAIADLQSKK